MTYKIEKNVPVPPRVSGKLCYPFGEMEIGDSFFVPEEERIKMANSLWAFKKKRPELDFTVRRVNGGGARVWRVEPEAPKESANVND